MHVGQKRRVIDGGVGRHAENGPVLPRPRQPLGQKIVVPGAQARGLDRHAQPFLALPQRFFGLAVGGDVGNRRFAEHDLVLRILDGDAAKLHRVPVPVMRHQVHFGSHLGAVLDALPHMVLERRDIVLCHVIDEGIAGQGVAIHAQQLCARQVDFLDIAVFIQGGIAQRREIVKIDVPIPVVLQLPLRGAQFLILPRQFGQLAGKFRDQALRVLRPRWRGSVPSVPKDGSSR